MEIVYISCGAAIAFVGGLLGGLLKDEAQGWLCRLPFLLLSIARKRLPAHLRDDLYSEWLGDLSYAMDKKSDRPITRVAVGVRYAVGLIRGARGIVNELSAAADASIVIDNMPYREPAVRYKRTSAVERLIDDTKLRSYWPYRETWLSSDQAGSDALVAVISKWAKAHPQLAAALDYAPPASAVEDLLHVNERRIMPLEAYTMLASELERALGGRS